jgi:hypothetical protein
MQTAPDDFLSQSHSDESFEEIELPLWDRLLEELDAELDEIGDGMALVWPLLTNS